MKFQFSKHINYWFTSDLHLGHRNILKYDNRPFKTVWEHDECIIDNWNECVKESDIVFHLGDFSFNSKSGTETYLTRLNGQKYFIKGNHDHKDGVKLFGKHGIFLGYGASIEVHKQVIVLCHYRFDIWDRMHRGAWHLHGHSHGNAYPRLKDYCMDVGINCNDYKPFSFDQVKEYMDNIEL